MAVQSSPILLNEDELKRLEVLRDVVRQDALKEYNINSIDELNQKHFTDKLSKYTLTKDEFQIGLKIYEFGADFIKTGNVQNLMDSIKQNREDIQRWDKLMSSLDPTYAVKQQKYDKILSTGNEE